MVREDGRRSRRETASEAANEGYDRPQAHEGRVGYGFNWEQGMGGGNQGAFNVMTARPSLTELVHTAEVGV